MSEEISAKEHARALLPKLRSDRLFYFPIRHHSPACAAHIERWILENKPKAVLVEGPSSFSSRIDALTDDACLCPVALYTNFVDKKARLISALGQSDPDSSDQASKPPILPEGLDFGAARFAAYYPFCDYSPEMIALRTGKKVGALLKFIDLEYAEMIITQFQESKNKPEQIRIESLAQDAHLSRSRYMKELAHRLGCRDFDELWDHLFEASLDSLSTDDFVDRLATYCAMARLDYTSQELAQDATTAREDCMAFQIVETLKETKGKILVVTGGFHTAALPDLVEQKRKRPVKPDFGEDELGVWLIKYSFDKLDALSGYSAGMPSPAYYERLWLAKNNPAFRAENRKEQFERVAAEVLVDISRLTRERKLVNLITTPDSIAAAQMTKQLAALRGHPWPLREDILDGVRSCFVKGELGVEGQYLFKLVNEILAGNRVGQVPPGGDVPPLLADFYKEAKKYRLLIEQVERKEYVLDLYRNARHRGLSRFFHRLDFLETQFARFVGGPNFVSGQGLDLMQEIWDAIWSPLVESALIEASVYGASLEEASANKLKLMIRGLEDEAQGRSSSAAVGLLIRACRLGLHAQSAGMVQLIDLHIAEDPHIGSVANALSQLELLQRAREPLEASNLLAVPRLINAAYLRACRLVEDLGRCPDSALEEALTALQTIKEVLSSFSSSKQDDADNNVFDLDESLFYQGLVRVIQFPPHEAQSTLIGAAAGILFSEGRISETELMEVVCGFLGGALNNPLKSVGILRGLLSTASELAWQLTPLINALDGEFESWDEQVFLSLLPDLRLAFVSLTPRDIARVADKVSLLHDGADLGELVHTDISASDLELGLRLNQHVCASLRADGLEAL